MIICQLFLSSRIHRGVKNITKNEDDRFIQSQPYLQITACILPLRSRIYDVLVSSIRRNPAIQQFFHLSHRPASLQHCQTSSHCSFFLVQPQPRWKTRVSLFHNEIRLPFELTLSLLSPPVLLLLLLADSFDSIADQANNFDKARSRQSTVPRDIVSLLDQRCNGGIVTGNKKITGTRRLVRNEFQFARMHKKSNSLLFKCRQYHLGFDTAEWYSRDCRSRETSNGNGFLALSINGDF